jgi:phospholipase/carboxylesterase
MKLLFGVIFIFCVTVLESACQNSTSESTDLFYLTREPKVKTENSPVIFLLHGVGSNEKDLFSFSDVFPDSFLIVSLRAPKKISENGFSWYDLYRQNGVIYHNSDEAEKSRVLLSDFIDKFTRAHKVDKNRIFLCGFSQGAIMSFSLGLSMPEKFRGIIALSGRILDEIAYKLPEESKFKMFDVLLIHGTDDKIIPIDFARTAKEFLQKHNISLNYNELALGHTISNETLKIMLKWLSEKK